MMLRNVLLTSKQICKADGIEVDDTPNPKMNQNGESGGKSKKKFYGLIAQRIYDVLIEDKIISNR